MESIDDGQIEWWLGDEAEPVKIERIKDVIRKFGELGAEIAALLAMSERQHPLSDEEFVVFEKLLTVLATHKTDLKLARGVVRFYFELTGRRFDRDTKPLIAEEVVKVRTAVGVVLDVLQSQSVSIGLPFVGDESSEILLRQLQFQYGDTARELPFWERYQDWESATQKLTGERVNAAPSAKSVSTVKDERGDEYVVKPYDMEADKEYDDPRKIALFQELTRYYGVKTVPEVTVLPSKDLFLAEGRGNFLRSIRRTLSHIVSGMPLPILSYGDNKRWSEEKYEKRKTRALRVARRIPFLKLPKIGQTRNDLAIDPRRVLEEWLPGDIFDDTRKWDYEDPYGRRGEHEIEFATLNKEKFRTWYDGLTEEEKEKMKTSLANLHDLVSDGFLIDLYAPFNFAIRDGEFILIDAEPMQLSNLPKGTPCISYSQKVLNDMFEIVGLSKISYSEIVRRHYGDEKFLRLKNRYPARLSLQGSGMPTPSEFWETNVTNAEELAHYRKQYTATRAQYGELPARTDVNPSLAAEAKRFLELPDSFFEGERYDWSEKL